MSETKAHSIVAGFDRIMGKIRGFLRETVAELKRCTWPSRPELLESTVLVVVVIAILACFVAGVDEVTRYVIRFVTTGKY